MAKLYPKRFNLLIDYYLLDEISSAAQREQVSISTFLRECAAQSLGLGAAHRCRFCGYIVRPEHCGYAVCPKCSEPFHT